MEKFYNQFRFVWEQQFCNFPIQTVRRQFFFHLKAFFLFGLQWKLFSMDFNILGIFSSRTWDILGVELSETLHFEKNTKLNHLFCFLHLALVDLWK